MNTLHTYSRYHCKLSRVIINQLMTLYKGSALLYFAIRKFTLFIKNIFLISAFIGTTCAWATSQSNHYLSHKVTDQQVIIATKQAQVTLTSYGHGIEVHYQNNDKKTTELPSFAIKEQAKRQAFTLSNDKNSLTLKQGNLTAIVSKQPFSIRYLHNNQLLVAEEAGFISEKLLANHIQDKQALPSLSHGFRFKLNQSEKLLGTGERVLGMDRRGHRLQLYNKAHYGYTAESSQMNFSIPAVMSSNKYILLFDNSAKGWLDLGKTEQNILQFEAVGGRASYIIFAGENYPELINNYVNLTGKQPMPPRWALGSFASRFGYRNQQEVLSTASKFLDLDIPLDAIILDLYWFGADIKGHMGNLAWDKNTFAEPEKMIAKLDEQGVKTVLITEPFILSSSKRWQEAVEQNVLAKTANGEPKRFDFYFGNTGLIDIFNSDATSWFNNIYTTLAEQGVAGWWGDLGEPEVHPSDTLHTFDDGTVVNADEIHNVYGHQWAKMLYENQSAHHNSRPFILMRSGFAGSQRYGMISWTGDVSRSWDGLKPQVELSLQMSLLGMGYTHSDLGGFAGGEKFDQALYIRWLQYGVFQPIFRPHAQDNIASEVVYHDKKTQDILREFIKLRYQLLPYNYTLAYENSTTGMPLMRPLFFEDETNLSLINNSQSYLWGDAFLVTPIVDEKQTSVSVNLPLGVWFDYFTGKRYQGEQTIQLTPTLATLPVLVRAGAFVPMIDSIQSTKNYSSEKLTLHYYADSSVKQSTGKMFDDDGSSRDSIANNQYELLQFSAKHSNDELSIALSHQGEYANMPNAREVTLVIHHLPSKPAKVVNKNTTMAVSDNQASNAYWNSKNNTLSVTFTWQHQPMTWKIK